MSEATTEAAAATATQLSDKLEDYNSNITEKINKLLGE